MQNDERIGRPIAASASAAIRPIEELPIPAFALGEAVKIDTATMKGRRFIVDEIRVWASKSGASMLDHVLVNIPRLNPPRPARIRVKANRDSIGSADHSIVVLTLYDELPYNEALENVVRDTTKKFIIDDDADPKMTVHEEFCRVNEMDGPHTCDVTANTGDDRSPKPSGIQYWDYSRLIDVEGVETEEFIFVEMNVESGWFQIWRGTEAALGQIAVL